MSNPSFSLQPFSTGGAYYAVLEDGPYRVSSQWYPSSSREAAIQSVADQVFRLADWKGSRYRGVGRKPRHYWDARRVAGLLRRLGLAPSSPGAAVAA